LPELTAWEEGCRDDYARVMACVATAREACDERAPTIRKMCLSLEQCNKGMMALMTEVDSWNETLRLRHL